MALPYDPAAYEYVGVEPVAVGHMENLTYDRLHTAGDKVLYPTFVNLEATKQLWKVILICLCLNSVQRYVALSLRSHTPLFWWTKLWVQSCYKSIDNTDFNDKRRDILCHGVLSLLIV